jgi:hypothetical protein
VCETLSNFYGKITECGRLRSGCCGKYLELRVRNNRRKDYCIINSFIFLKYHQILLKRRNPNPSRFNNFNKFLKRTEIKNLLVMLSSSRYNKIMWTEWRHEFLEFILALILFVIWISECSFFVTEPFISTEYPKISNVHFTYDMYENMQCIDSYAIKIIL